MKTQIEIDVCADIEVEGISVTSLGANVEVGLQPDSPRIADK